LKQTGKQRYVSPYNIALIHAALAQNDLAFHWLEKALQERFWMVAFLKVDPRWDSLRNDARFDQLLQRAGFGSNRLR
jgi:hypothetical protein